MRSLYASFAGAVAIMCAGCTAQSVSNAQSVATAACVAAPLLDASTSATDQANVAKACAAEQAVAPIVAPLVTKTP